MVEQIIHGLVPAELFASLPGTLDRCLGRSDHEIHVDDVAEAGEQTAAVFLARI